MLSRKGPGRHPAFGRIYYGSLAAAVAFALVLSAMRWPQNLPLAILGVLAFVAAILGRAVRRRRPAWIRAHIASMAASYVLMLTAFYVDNGKNLPLWKALPPIAYWLAPLAVGAPLTIWVMIRHPLARSRAS
jgi:ribose/xylose/arabinose/galactoside ABC-type transport system permease subunit